MSLNREAKLKQGMVDLAAERDDILRGVPNETQILILSTAAAGSNAEQLSLVTPNLQCKLFPESIRNVVADEQSESKKFDDGLLNIEKFKILT